MRVSASGHRVQPSASSRTRVEARPRPRDHRARHRCSVCPDCRPAPPLPPPRWRPTRTRSSGASTMPVATPITRSPSKRVCDGCERPGETVVAALGEQEAVGLRGPGVGGDDHERGVLPLHERLRERGPAGRRRRPGQDRAVGADHVADRVHDRQRADRRAPLDARARAAEAALHRVVGAPPRPDPRAAARADPTRRRGTGSPSAASAAARPSAAVGRTPPSRRDRRSRRVGTIGTAPPRVITPAALLGQVAITPSAAARPNADPPVKHHRVDLHRPCAWARATRARASPVRRRGPRPSRPFPAGSRTTVTPVCRHRSSARRGRRRHR